MSTPAELLSSVVPLRSVQKRPSSPMRLLSVNGTATGQTLASIRLSGIRLANSDTTIFIPLPLPPASYEDSMARPLSKLWCFLTRFVAD